MAFTEPLKSLFQVWIPAFWLVLRGASGYIATNLMMSLAHTAMRALAVAMLVGLYSQALGLDSQIPQPTTLGLRPPEDPLLGIAGFLLLLLLIGTSGHLIGLTLWKSMSGTFLFATSVLLKNNPQAFEKSIVTLPLLQITKHLVTVLAHFVSLAYLGILISIGFELLGNALILMSLGGLVFAIAFAKKSSKSVSEYQALSESDSQQNGDVSDEDEGGSSRSLKQSFHLATSKSEPAGDQLSEWSNSKQFLYFMKMRRSILMGRHSSQAIAFPVATAVALLPLGLLLIWPTVFSGADALYLAGLMSLVAQSVASLSSTIALLGKFYVPARILAESQVP